MQTSYSPTHVRMYFVLLLELQILILVRSGTRFFVWSHARGLAGLADAGVGIAVRITANASAGLPVCYLISISCQQRIRFRGPALFPSSSRLAILPHFAQRDSTGYSLVFGVFSLHFETTLLNEPVRLLVPSSMHKYFQRYLRDSFSFTLHSWYTLGAVFGVVAFAVASGLTAYGFLDTLHHIMDSSSLSSPHSHLKDNPPLHHYPDTWHRDYSETWNQHHPSSWHLSGISATQYSTGPLLDIPKPANKNQIISFLVFLHFYRDSDPRFLVSTFPCTLWDTTFSPLSWPLYSTSLVTLVPQ